MKTSSWEIIIAGFIFVGISIYLINQNSEATAPPQKESAATTDSIRINLEGNDLRVVQLKSLQNLENLENLENLKNLENLQNLKNLTTFLPEELQADFESEIDEVIQEFEQESVKIEVNPEQGTLSINSIKSVTSGSWTPITPGVFAYVKEFDASQLNQTELNMPFGSIEIMGTTTKEAKLTIEASGQVSNRAELESRIKTTANIGPDKAEFTISPRNKTERNHNIQLHATLTIPSNVQVKSITKAGHITSQNINGKQTYSTLGGHIKLSEVTGDIDASTSGGHISVKNSKGSLNLNSKGGHIVTKSAEGTIVMNTSGGNLKASEINGAIKAATNGGNIELSFLGLNGSVEANTGAGTISIWIPASSNTNVDLSGNLVEIAPALNFNGNSSAGSATGTIGNGTHSIVAKTNYGKVFLKVLD